MLKFCFKLRKIATETYNLLLEMKRVFYFFKIFRVGLEDLENVPRIRWLSSAQNPETFTNVYVLLVETIKLPKNFICNCTVCPRTPLFNLVGFSRTAKCHMECASCDTSVLKGNSFFIFRQSKETLRMNHYY